MSLPNLLEKLNGRRTHIGAVALSLLGLVSSLDILIHGEYRWLPAGAYAGIGTFIGGMTGVAMRLAIGKTLSFQELAKEVAASLAKQDVNATVEQLKKTDA